MTEEWRDVVGYEDLFKVSNLGRLFSKRTDKILKLNPVGNEGASYLAHVTKIGGRKGKNIVLKVHQEVAKAFLPEPNQHQKDWAKNAHYKKVYINHKDGDKSNNRLDNLEWCTNLENIRHYFDELGGSEERASRRHPQAKLQDKEVLEVRDLIAYGFSQRAVASMYGISRNVVHYAVNGYKWVS